MVLFSFSVTPGAKDSPMFLCVQTLWLRSETFSEAVKRCSQHICLWRWAESLFCEPPSGTREIDLALGGNFLVWYVFFFPPSRLLSLRTVEEPRVPTLEVTLTTSCWLLLVSLCWAVGVRTPTTPPQPFNRKKNKTKQLAKHLVFLLLLLISHYELPAGTERYWTCARETPSGRVPSGASTSPFFLHCIVCLGWICEIFCMYCCYNNFIFILFF